MKVKTFFSNGGKILQFAMLSVDLGLILFKLFGFLLFCLLSCYNLTIRNTHLPKSTEYQYIAKSKNMKVTCISQKENNKLNNKCWWTKSVTTEPIQILK